MDNGYTRRFRNLESGENISAPPWPTCASARSAGRLPPYRPAAHNGTVEAGALHSPFARLRATPHQPASVSLPIRLGIGGPDGVSHMVALLPGASSPNGFANFGPFVIRISTKCSSCGQTVLALRVPSLTAPSVTRIPVSEKEHRIACGEVVYEIYCLIGRIPVLCHVSASLRQTSPPLTPYHALNSTHPTQGRYIQRRHGRTSTRIMDNPVQRSM